MIFDTVIGSPWEVFWYFLPLIAEQPMQMKHFLAVLTGPLDTLKVWSQVIHPSLSTLLARPLLPTLKFQLNWVVRPVSVSILLHDISECVIFLYDKRSTYGVQFRLFIWSLIINKKNLEIKNSIKVLPFNQINYILHSVFKNNNFFLNSLLAKFLFSSSS